ncbi:MAG: type II toxin-antitoxin system HicB family antitoxin [Bacteroidetes bacterium]|nr:type II toxin-antitoxin system HicB family antitoxin [Bacteroidota bacterium]
MKDVMKYKEYLGSVQYSAEDQVFYGKLEGTADLVTFEGASVDQLQSSFEEAVDDYLEICENTGKSPLKSYKGSLNVRIQPDLHKKAASLSVRLGLSLNNLIEKAISEWVSAHEIHQ